VQDGSIPGAIIIVKSPAWGVRVGTTGFADLAKKTAFSPNMQFRIGSVTKAFLAQGILRLEQEGKIKLSTPVLDVLGDAPVVKGIPYIGAVTVGNLLQMTSGITNYLGYAPIRNTPQLEPQKQYDASQLVAPLGASGLPDAPGSRDFVPGTTYPNPYWVEFAHQLGDPPAPAPYPYWLYSNSNYILLGMIAEKVTGLKAEEFLKRYVFDIAGLPDTFMATDDQKLPVVHGYTKNGALPYDHRVYDKWCDVTAVNPSYAWTAGAVVSTPWDLLKFGETMFKTDKLLDEGTKNKWYTFVSSDIHFGWEVMEYGVGGLMQPQRSYGTARGHGGAFPGYKALLYYFYDQDTFFILATNTWDTWFEKNKGYEEALLDAIMPLVSSAVTTPKPASGSHVTERPGGKVTLAWQAGRVYGDSYRIFWGRNADAVDRASDEVHPDVAGTTVKGLDVEIEVAPGSTYYWRVDTIAPGTASPRINGPLWSFRTR
jgi:CubicO group peptidase (beta-lactamase class C family)